MDYAETCRIYNAAGIEVVEVEVDGLTIDEAYDRAMLAIDELRPEFGPYDIDILQASDSFFSDYEHDDFCCLENLGME